MNSSDVLSQRLRNQKLSAPAFRQPADVVRWLGAVQAQDFQAAKWALALRMRAATDASIEAAFNEGQMIRTHLMRPTWHFVAPENIRWLLQLTAPRVNLKCGPNNRKFELDAATFKRTNRVLTKALQGGKHLTRSALKTALNKAGIVSDDPVRLAHILLRAELDGVVCSGPRIGKQFSYALLDERVAETNTLSRDEALAELTRRYFTSHGPATLQDFVWWSGLTTTDARRGIEMIDRAIREELVAEKLYWTAQTKANSQRSIYSTHLLPAFDEYNVAYKDRELVLNNQTAIKPWDLLGPTLIIDGRIAGTWRRTNNSNSVVVALNVLDDSERSAIASAAERYATFLGVSTSISI